MNSLEEIEQENKQFAKQWWSQLLRGAAAIFIGAVLFLLFSPDTLIEYAASSLFIAPLFIWAYKSPESKKSRIITSVIFYATSVVIYFGWV